MNKVQMMAPNRDVFVSSDVGRRFTVADNTNSAPTVRLVDSFAKLTDKERESWQALERQAGVTVPFQSLFYNESWWDHFGCPKSSAKTLQIFIVEDEDEIIGVFPMLRQNVAVAGMPMLSYLQPLGTDNVLTELRTGLVKNGAERTVYAALIAFFKNDYRKWDVISLPAGPAEVADLYAEVSIDHPGRPRVEGFCIALEDDLDAFRSGLKRNIKESIRKCYNSPKRDNVEFEFRCLTSAKAIQEFLPRFYELHATRAQQEFGTDHRDVFQQDSHRKFIENLVNHSSTSGVRLYTLEHDGKVVAARLGFETDCANYLYYSGYEPEYGKYSVMTRLVYEVIRHSIDAGKKFVNLSFGRDVSKTRWSPRVNDYRWNLMFRKSLRGLTTKFALTSIMRLESGGYLPAMRLS